MPAGQGGISRGLSREEYIRRVFAKRIDFMHRRAEFVYVPVAKPTVEKVLFQAARVGRLVDAVEAEPPEAGLTRPVAEVGAAERVRGLSRGDSPVTAG